MKTVTRTIKVKLYPNAHQRNLILQHGGANRYIYNYMLGLSKDIYEKSKTRPTGYDMSNMITLLKQQDEYKWLLNIHSQTLQQSTTRLERAYTRFFLLRKQGKQVGLPRFKSKKHSIDSFTYPQGVKVNEVGSKLFLPKIGNVKIRGYRSNFISDIKTCTVKIYTDGVIEASITGVSENQTTPNTNFDSIGIDVGTRKFITDSTGTKIYPLNLSNQEYKLKRLQRSLDRMSKGSNNYNRTINTLRKQYRHISNKKLNWLHHVTNQYVIYRNVYVEDLNITSMVVNTVGTIDNPNYDSKQKTRLNHKILQQSWGMFFDILKYKLNDRVSLLHRVDPSYTSQTCSKCGTVSKSNRNGEKYTCSTCGNHMDADVNAAVNILHRGYSEKRLEPSLNVT